MGGAPACRNGDLHVITNLLRPRLQGRKKNRRKVPITPDQYKQLKSIYLAAEGLPRSEREAYLKSVHADQDVLTKVEEMLAMADTATYFRTGGAAEYAPELFTGSGEDRMIGRRVGHYEIIREIAAGGMGKVYLAVRSDDFRKHVAIKLLHSGAAWSAAEERFRAERQILAELDHPNIARLLDGGNTEEGQPYLVMELIEGLPIDIHCDQYRLTVDQRLQLFLDVCCAVQYRASKPGGSPGYQAEQYPGNGARRSQAPGFRHREIATARHSGPYHRGHRSSPTSDDSRIRESGTVAGTSNFDSHGRLLTGCTPVRTAHRTQTISI